MSKISNRQIIRDYIEFHKGYFTCVQCHNVTDLPMQTIRNVVGEFEKLGIIKVIRIEKKGTKVYLKVVNPIKGIEDKPSDETLARVKAQWEIDKKQTHEQISKILGISRSSVSMAIKALRDRGDIPKEEKLTPFPIVRPLDYLKNNNYEDITSRVFNLIKAENNMSAFYLAQKLEIPLSLVRSSINWLKEQRLI